MLGSEAGTYIVADVFVGTVTSRTSWFLFIFQLLFIRPYIETYFALTQVKSPTMAGRMTKCLKPGCFASSLMPARP